MNIIDRRLNPERQEPRQPAALPAPRQGAGRRTRCATPRPSASITRAPTRGGEVAIPPHGIHEPTFHHAAQGGMRDHVLPGNKEYVAGDEIPRPPGGGGGGGSRRQPGRRGRGRVPLRADPRGIPRHLLRRPRTARPGQDAGWWRAPTRPGTAPAIRVSGSPANLSLPRTMRNSLSRRIALRRPKPEEVEALRERDRPAGGRAATPEAGCRRCATELERHAAPQQAHPLHRPGRRALPPLRAGAAARSRRR